MENLSLDLDTISHEINMQNFPKIKAYESLLIQLFQNLLSNSIKYRQEDQQLKINIECEENQEFVTFSVTDNGIGIDPSDNKDPFQLFSRLDIAQQFEGTGLGLSLCKRIILLHNGTISMKSKGLDQGTTIVFNLKKTLNNSLIDSKSN